MWAVADAVTSLDVLMREMAKVGTVVAIRYHNVLCALMLGKPTVSLSYASKHDFLMADMGLPEFCLPQDLRRRPADRAVHRAPGPFG